MPARTGHSYAIPGVGTTVRSKSGKAKSFAGKGPAPSGTKKVREATATTVPTVEVQPTGNVVAKHFRRQQAAEAQIRKAKRSERRVTQILRSVAAHEQETPKRPPLPTYEPPKIPVVSHTRSLPGPTTKKTVPVQPHARSAPTQPKLTLVESNPGIPGKQAPSKRYVVKNVPTQPKLKGTPQQRQQARAKVQGTKRAIAHAGPQLVGDLGPEQKQFVLGVAKHTGLSPRTIGAQARAEESEGAQTEAEGTHNFLNMGPGIRYGSLREGIRETAKNYNTNPLYAGVRATKGQPPAAQVRAIAESPWGTGPLIEQTLPEVGLKHGNPKALANYKAAVKEAKELGLKVSALGNVGKPSPKLVKRTVAAEHAMREVEGLPYVWGGGHGSPTSSPTGGGLDCSGAVGYVLNKIGALHGSLTSGEMGSVLKPGPGALTVFYNSAHTFLRLINRKGEPEYWGTSVGDSGAGGLTRHPTPSASYLAEYNVGHVPGMGRKQALQLGADPGSLTGASPSSFPGMTFSPSGTTATITEGTTKSGQPGFSKKPIKVNPVAEAKRTLHQLKVLGAGVGEAKAPETKSSGLADLERRYGKAAV